jgi:hypothetical protein
MAINAINGIAVDEDSTILGLTGLASVFGIALEAGGGGGAPTPDILWYKMNAGSGTVLAADVGGAGTTDAAWVTGASGSDFAQDFNGTTHAASSDADVTFGVNIITICCWLYMDDTSTTQILLESSEDAGAGGHCFEIELGGGNIQPTIFSNGVFYRRESVAATSGVWTHWAFVLDNSTNSGQIKVFKNGAEESTTLANDTKGSTANFTDKTVYIGARNESLYYYNGRMDDLRIYAGELSGAEISAIYADPQ